jgi:hypothetical protein
MSSVVLLDFISTWGLNCHHNENIFDIIFLFIIILDFLYHFLQYHGNFVQFSSNQQQQHV